jgi:hypothetical protein
MREKNMTKIWALIFFILLLQTTAWAQNCSTEKGINLSDPGKPYQSIFPINQGKFGTCFVHSASSLLKSFTGIGDYINILDASVNADLGVNGGHPDEVIDALVQRGWICKDYSAFRNFFPNEDKHILSELLDITVTMPVFYSNEVHTSEGRARQMRIAKLAAKVASAPGDCVICNQLTAQDKMTQDLYKKMSDTTSVLMKLRNELNTLDIGWLNKLMGDRNNKEIEADIKSYNLKYAQLEKQLKTVNAQKDKNIKYLNEGKNKLDDVTEDEAAKIVYYWARDNYNKMKEVFKKYGASDETVPTLAEFIVDRVQYNEDTKFMYAGGMYPYKLMKRVMAKSCENNRVPIPKNIITKSISTSLAGPKIKALLEKNPPQGVNLNFHANLLSKGTWDGSDNSDFHAVNLIGCRTKNGKLQYLVHNSWGPNCDNYHSKYECIGGRVWVNADSLMSAGREVIWLEKN